MKDVLSRRGRKFSSLLLSNFSADNKEKQFEGEKGVIFGGEFAPVDCANGVHLLPLLPAALPEGILAKKKR